MKVHKITSRRMSLRTAILAAAIVLPAASGGPALADQGSGITAAEQPEFHTTFAALPAPTRDFDTPPGAVDITEIDIPVEPQPAVRTLGSGIASYYGKRFNGRRTANGERFDMNALTAAHKTLPFGTKVLVTNPHNGKTVTVRINDRGPYAHGRCIDLSRAAAKQIGLVQRGHGTVEMAILES